MSYKIYVKNGSEKEYSFYSYAKTFTNAIKAEKELKGLGCLHVLCLGVKYEH